MAKKVSRKAVKKSGQSLEAARASAKARKASLVSRSEQAQDSRQKNVSAGTARMRIKGHVSSSGRAAQAKRDTKHAGSDRAGE